MAPRPCRGAPPWSVPRFDLEQFLALLQDQRITQAYVAPPIVLALAKHPLVDKYDLSALKSVFSGAAPWTPASSRPAPTGWAARSCRAGA